MKKTFLAAMMAATVLSQAHAENAATKGVINFTGEVIAESCTVAIGDQNKTVALPTVAAGQLAASGNTAGDTAFSINLENCKSEDKHVYANFLSTPVDTANGNVASNGNLDNKASGGAENVQIALYATTGERINLLTGDNEASTAKSAVTESPELRYIAKYFATGAASVGSVSSSVEFNLAYQ